MWKNYGEERRENVSKYSGGCTESNTREEWRVRVFMQWSDEVGEELFYIYKRKASMTNEGTKRCG